MSQRRRSPSPDGASAPQKLKNGNDDDDDDDRRSILVSNIPHTLTDDKVMIHFQRSSSGGGDVRQVRRLSPSQAKVIFEDVKVIDRVVTRKHELDGVTLQVEAWSSFLGRALEVDRASHRESSCVQRAVVQIHQPVTRPVWDSYRQKLSNTNLKVTLNRSGGNDVVTLKGSWNDVVEARSLFFDLLSEVDEAETPSRVDSKRTRSRNGQHQTEEGVTNNHANHHANESQHQQQGVINNGTENPDEDYTLERVDLDRKEREGASSAGQLLERKEKNYSASSIRNSAQVTKIDESRLDNLRGFDRSQSLESREDDRLKEATGDGTQTFQWSMSAPDGASSTYGSSKTRATRPQQDTTPPHQFSEPLREEPNSRLSFESKMSGGATSTLHDKTAFAAEESRGGQSLSHSEGRTRPGGTYKLADMSDDEDDDVSKIGSSVELEQPVEPDILSYIIKVHSSKIITITERHRVTLCHNDEQTVVYLRGSKKNAKDALEDFITMYQGLFGKIKSISLDTNMHNHVKSDVCSYAVECVQKSSPTVFIKNTDGQIVFIGEESEVRSARAEICSILKISESRRRKPHTSSAPTSPTVLGPGQASATAMLSNLSLGDKLVFLDKIKGIQICVVEGDITQQKVDVIVNAANGSLSLNWGVSRAISKAGGSSIQTECDKHIRQRRYINLKTTDCVWTRGGSLPCKYVIHAVGPMYSGTYGSHKCQQELHDTCHKVLRMAATDLKAMSIAMPAISSGACGMPKDLCAESMFSAITDFIENVNPRHNIIVDIRIIDNDRKAAEVFSEIFSKMSARFKATHVTNPNLQPRYPPSGPPSSPGTSGTTAVSHGTSQTSPAFQVSSSSSSGVGSVSYPGPTQEYVAAVSSSYPHDKSTATSYPHSTPGYPGSGDLTQTYPGASGTQPSQSHSTYWQTQPSNSRNTSSFSSPRASSASSASGSSDKGDTCPICLCDFTGPVTTTRCKHKFCTDCLDSALKLSGQCPVCKSVIGRLKGNQPHGTMTHRTDYLNSLRGYEGHPTIEIHYDFHSGIQGPEHPNPGKPYTGTSRTAYLPDNLEGREVLHLLKRAFDSRLVFTIGTSATTGRTDTVVWNDIHHKTSKYGGPNSYGYPDPQYLTRVKEELAAKGIK